jgi:hypothetical protein
VSKEKLTLAQLIQALHEEGATDAEAERVVAQYLDLRKRSDALATRTREQIDFPTSPQLAPGQQPRDYGDETPEEAEQRWMWQETVDPEGLFSGGQTAGGIFGDGPIPTDRYDPAAVRRTVDLAGPQVRTEGRTVQLLEKILEKLSGPAERPRLGNGETARRLGKRKPR